jgi:3-hydroxyacyl-CoA dehydrogenase
MKLVEVIPAFDTSEATFDFACRMCREAGKTRYASRMSRDSR